MLGIEPKVWSMLPKHSIRVPPYPETLFNNVHDYIHSREGVRLVSSNIRILQSTLL